MAARQNDSILRISVADDALSLKVTLHRHRCIVNAEHIVQIENRFVVEQLLFKYLELILCWTVIVDGLKHTVRKLHLFFCSSLVALREHSLDANHDRVVVILLVCQLMLHILTEIKLTYALCKFLFKTRTEHVRLWHRVFFLVRIETKVKLAYQRLQKRIGRGVPAFCRAKIDCNCALVICRKHEFNVVLLLRRSRIKSTIFG